MLIFYVLSLDLPAAITSVHIDGITSEPRRLIKRRMALSWREQGYSLRIGHCQLSLGAGAQWFQYRFKDHI